VEELDAEHGGRHRRSFPTMYPMTNEIATITPTTKAANRKTLNR
jgi:hypothetical protein